MDYLKLLVLLGEVWNATKRQDSDVDDRRREKLLYVMTKIKQLLRGGVCSRRSRPWSKKTWRWPGLLRIGKIFNLSNLPYFLYTNTYKSEIHHFVSFFYLESQLSIDRSPPMLEVTQCVVEIECYFSLWEGSSFPILRLLRRHVFVQDYTSSRSLVEVVLAIT